MIVLRYLLITLLLSSCTQDIPVYRLLHANDADSCFVTDYECMQDCERIELRLIGIDAPEYKQDPWGKRALNYLLDNIKADTKIYLQNGIEEYDK
ncbi:MAG: hypothetical protein OXU45_07095, partial [Candidatus Melainabacteria bacterium]|nr:hypothetical protein [Candidatus Melainabacteria bacterium]